MKRLLHLPYPYIYLVGLVLLLGGLVINQKVNAQDGGTGRFKTVEVQTVQYVWELVDSVTGNVICEVTIDRDGKPTNQEALSFCADKIYPIGATPAIVATASSLTPQPTALPFNVNAFFQRTFWRFVTKREFTQTVKVPLPEMVLNITVPSGAMEKPYITLTAYEPAKEYKIVSIVGKRNQADFICQGDRCNIPINQITLLTFRSLSSSGDYSHEVQATIQIVFRSDGYYLSLASLSPFTLFQDICAAEWGAGGYVNPKWAEFPQMPDGLYTSKSLYFLASRLLFTGIVDAKDCPNQGFLSQSSPNGCGMERVKTAMIDWQNMYNPVIWSASRKIGVPPKIIKTLIEKESQFWPGNSRLFIQEFGLAQINQFGADVALRWNNDLFKQACSTVLGDCSRPYASLPGWQQDMLRGSLMNLINADCTGCVDGFDQTTANQSIEVIANVLRANCSQARYIIKDNFGSASYEDMWKFTLVSYHSGYQCLNEAIESAFRSGANLDWVTVSSYLKCAGAKEYVEDFWANLTSFDQYVKQPVVDASLVPQPTFVPTRTPEPTPIPVLSKNTIRVFVYVDNPGQTFPNDISFAEGVVVQVNVPDGTVYSKTVTGGQTTFDMSAHAVGTEVTISLPGFYRSYLTVLTEQGEILVPFRLQQANLPPVLP